MPQIASITCETGVLLSVHSAGDNLQVIFIGSIGGFLGSLIDSVLGATVQYSGWCSRERKVVETPGPTVTRISGIDLLDNHQVRCVCVCVWVGVCVFAYVVMCGYVCVFTCMWIHICVDVYVRVFVCLCVYACACGHVYI
jgi:uncharacterized membrane protein